MLEQGSFQVPTSVDWPNRWDGLAKQGFPMIFHGVVGEDKREERSPSFFNAEEAVIVVNYLEKLLTNKQKVKVGSLWAGNFILKGEVSEPLTL